MRNTIVILAMFCTMECLCNAAQQEPHDKNTVSSINLLFVFGMEEEKCGAVVAESKQRIEQLLKTTGVSPDVPFRKDMKRVKADQIIFLDSKDASPKNILKICREWDANMGKDGALLVYFVCRDAETAHGQMLYPMAKSKTDWGEGLLRKDVFEAITKNERRLTLLITDGCASDTTQYSGGEMSSWSSEPIYMFSAMLAYGQGKYNIRAASPAKNERPHGTPEMGTFFTNVFVNCMDAPTEDTGQFDMKSMVEELQAEMTNLFREVIDSENRQQNQTIMLW